MTRPTASSLARVIACPASAALPQAGEASEMATLGTEIHRYLQLVPSVGQEAALAEIPEEYRDICERIPLDQLPLAGTQEIGVAYNVRTGRARELARGATREETYQDLQDDEIGGIADVAEVADGELNIYDYKAGFLAPDPAARNWQLKFLFLAIGRLLGITDGQGVLIRMPGGGWPYVDRARYDVMTQLETHAAITRAWEQVQRARELVEQRRIPNVSAGPWCRYCPAMAYCPPKVALLHGMATGEALMELGAALDSGQVAGAYHRLQDARGVLKATERQIYGIAAQAPIPLGGGQYLGEQETRGKRQIVDDDRAVAVLARHVGEAAEQAVTRSTTIGAITAVIGQVAAKGQGAKLKREVLAELEAEGAVMRPYKRDIVVYDLPPGDP